MPDYVAACKLSALSGVRIGIPRNVISLLSSDLSRPVTDAFEQALGVLRAAGATIIENANFTAAAEFRNSRLGTVILEADFVINLQSYLESLSNNPTNITSLADLRQFTKSFALEGYPLRDTGRWDEALDGWNNTDPRFWPAYQQNLYYGGEGGVLGAIERNNLDAIVLPTDFASDWAAPVGSPIVTVPLGSYPAGVPITNNSWGLVTSAPNMPYVRYFQML